MSELMNFGFVAVPRGWETVQDVAFLEPRRPAARAMTMAKTTPPPRANIRVQRRRVDPRTSPAVACKRFLDEVQRDFQGVHAASESYLFGDGSLGEAALLVVPSGAKRFVQKHAFRVDGDVLTQITATIHESQKERMDHELDGALRSYRPDGQPAL